MFIDFLITQQCNYRCEYCSQSKKFVQNYESASKETIDGFLKFLSKVDKPSEITISGGEPLCHKEFFSLVDDIVKLGHRVCVVSNFSFPFENYEKLKNIAGENLSEIFVSLHLSQVNSVDDFLQKAKRFNSIKGNTKFTVGSVLSDENCSELKKVYEFLDNEGIKFELQHMRIKNAFVKYGKEADDFIKKFSISEIKKKSATYGKICRAGQDFIFIYQNGDVYRCYSSRFNIIHSMGNIKNKNFKLYSCDTPCLNKNCTCPKPISMGMINFKKSALMRAYCLSLYNAMWIPYFGVKNFGIIKSKILQAINLKK